MIPNELGKTAGFTKRDASRLGKAERDLVNAAQLIRQWEELTGQVCSESEDCATLLEQHARLREMFFDVSPDEPE